MPTVVLRSRDRDQGTANDFTIRSQMLLPPGEYRLKHVVMPCAVFTFGPTNCDFKFTFDGSTGTASIEHGFYDGFSAAAVLHAAVNAAHGQGAVTISFDPIKGRIKITTPSSFVVHGSDDIPNSCIRQYPFKSSRVPRPPFLFCLLFLFFSRPFSLSLMVVVVVVGVTTSRM